MKNVKNSPLSDAAKREMIIDLAKGGYTTEDLSYISKNSNFTAMRAIKTISEHHIQRETLRRNFVTLAEKILNK